MITKATDYLRVCLSVHVRLCLSVRVSALHACQCACEGICVCVCECVCLRGHAQKCQLWSGQCQLDVTRPQRSPVLLWGPMGESHTGLSPSRKLRTSDVRLQMPHVLQIFDRRTYFCQIDPSSSIIDLSSTLLYSQAEKLLNTALLWSCRHITLI